MLLAVTGKPIAHSASPELHRAGMSALGINGASIRIIADSASEALRVCKELGVKGLNVTAPFKEEILVLLDQVSPEALSLGAVNTVLFDKGKTSGFNTDVFGITETISAHIGGLGQSSMVVILGAGGAAKAACKALDKLEQPFVIIGRGKEKTEQLAQTFNVDYALFEDKKHPQVISDAALIINCLSTLNRPFKEGLLKRHQILLDAHYKQESEIFKEAKKVGAKILSSLDWLIHQSRESQRIFFGKIPPYEVLKSHLVAKKSKSISLIGMMGSGKSAVGNKLATKLGYQYVDLDRKIEKMSSMSISDIFSKKGEHHFRELEQKLLCAGDHSSPHVLSCGGGIVLDQFNRKFLQANYRVVWIWARSDTLAARMKDDNSRPLLKNSGLPERLQELIDQRMNSYAQTADLLIGSDQRSEDEVMERVYEEVC